MKGPFAAVLVLLLAVAPASSAQELTQSELEERLTCQCGCGLTVHTCNHLQCSFAIPVKEDIAASLAKGESGDEILRRYVSEYGEKILSSPTTRGFNLLAWTAPYAAVGAGALVLLLALRRWTRARSGDPEHGPVPVPPSAAEGAARDRLTRELEEMDT